MQLFLKMLSGMANSVDPDQMAPDHGLHCLHFSCCQKLWDILEHFKILTVHRSDTAECCI